MISATNYDTDSNLIPLHIGLSRSELLPTRVVFNECEKFAQCLPWQSLHYIHTPTLIGYVAQAGEALLGPVGWMKRNSEQL